MAEEKQKFCCQGSATCGYVYDPEWGDKKGKIPKGVCFQELPPDWKCPCCSVSKDKFQPIEE